MYVLIGHRTLHAILLRKTADREPSRRKTKTIIKAVFNGMRYIEKHQEENAIHQVALDFGFELDWSITSGGASF